MKNWKFLVWVLALVLWFSGINLAAGDQNGKKDRKILDDAFKIALNEKDDDDDDDNDMEKDDGDDDKKMIPPPKNIEDLWRIVFEEVDELNPEETKKFYETNFPFIIERAKRMIKEEPKEVVHFLEGELDEYEDVLEEKNENPEQFKRWVNFKKNENKSYELAEKIRELSRKKEKSEADKTAIQKNTDELKDVLGILFELRLAEQKREIENLRNEIKEVESHVKKREASREKIIERKLNQMTGKEEDLEW